jgi:xanthine/uracil/vitamin C permease (AzgA family)
VTGDFFEIQERGSTARTEVLGGITTFTTMAYINRGEPRHPLVRTELVPAFATIAMLVFTYNIANGLTAGLGLYPIVKSAAGRASEVRPGAWALAGMSFLYYAFGLPH